MNLEKLDQVIQSILDAWGTPGMGVGIVEGDEIVHARGFGVQSLDRHLPVSPESIFCIASITKCFVATALMQLVERGTVELDTPLVRYLPYFKMDDARYTQITIRQMLSHTSGMPDMDELAYEQLVRHAETDEGAAERYVRALASQKMVANPGERFIYSNIAYNVLGDLIAKVSAQTFETYLKEQILIPAGMPNSSLLPGDLDPQKLSSPHVRLPELTINPVFPYHRADAPASFLHTSVVEMCHWCTTCLNQGSYAGRTILRPDSYALMWAPVAQRSYPPLYESYGLGWSLGHLDGVRTVSHGGGGFGWSCFLILLPEKRRAAIILCNEESSAHSQVTDAVIQTLLDKEAAAGAVSWVVPVCQALQKGGIEQAHRCYAEIRDNPAYFFDADGLVTLVYQLIGAEKIELAIELLRLNLVAFPGDVGSNFLLAKLYLKKGDLVRAKAVLQEAQAAAPNSRAVAELLAKVSQ